MRTTPAIVAGIVVALALATACAFKGTNKAIAPIPGDYTYTTNAAGRATITGFNVNYAGALVIAKRLGGCPVTAIECNECKWPRSDGRAFGGCTNLTRVTIPASITRIGVGAFSSCTGLTNIIIPASVTSLGICSFSRCRGLTSITIPASVTNIGEMAFSECTRLTNITFRNGLISIGTGAFRSCTNLTSVRIPASVTSIGDAAFYRCTSLKAIIVDAANKKYSTLNGALFNKDRTTLIQYFGDKGSYVVPASVTTIANEAFFCCNGLTNINIPLSVSNIGDIAFQHCTSLPDLFRRGGMFSSGDYTYCVIYDRAAILSFNRNYVGALVITNSLGGYPVTRIHKGAFFACTKLTSVTIPANVIDIGDIAFSGCTALTNIIIPTSVTYFGSNVFQNCPNLPVRIQNLAPKPLIPLPYLHFGG